MPNPIRQLQHQMHTSTDTGNFMATSAGDSSFQSQITGLYPSDNEAYKKELHNHLGREYYRKLNEFGLTPDNMDQLDAGFRPLTITGLYEAP